MSPAPEIAPTIPADPKVTTIATGTATATAVGFMSGGAYGLLVRGMNPIVTAASMGLNFGIVSLGFFSIRELVVSPLLVKNLDWEEYVRRRHALAVGESSSSWAAPTLSKMRTEGLLDTAIAGACTGVALNSARRGARGIIPGAVTVSLAFSGLQYVANSLRIARLQYLAAQKRETAVTVTSPSPMDSEQSPSYLPGTSPPTQPPTSSPSSLFDKLKSFSPVKRLTQEEFAALKERGRKGKEEEKAESPERPSSTG